MGDVRAVRGVLLVLAAAALGYPLAPAGVTQDIWYDGLGAVCVAVAWCGLQRGPADHIGAWRLLLAGFAGWVAGDALTSLQDRVWHMTAYPLPADGVYLVSYALLGVGLVRLIPRRRSRDELWLVVEAAIVGTGIAVVSAVFVIAPMVTAPGLGPWGKLVAAAYPVADVMVIAVLARLWLMSVVNPAALALLGAACSVTLVSDLAWQYAIIETGSTAIPDWVSAAYLLGYVLMAAACWASANHRPPRARVRLGESGSRAELGALFVAMLLPGAALLIDGPGDQSSDWLVVGLGSMVISVLALLRAWGLVRTVQDQSRQLADLARSDPLTGAPNRRTWDFELSRACRVAREQQEPLCVAMLDLDHFKAYNDTHGHQAGDLLLREAVAAWSDCLTGREMLARYGGEEFAVLLPGLTPTEATVRLQGLQSATPAGQTFSAGVVPWHPGLDAADAVRRADDGVYRAKRGGRDQICVVSGTDDAAAVAEPRVVLQPIYSLDSGDLVGVEALTRFPGEGTQAAFERAHRAGVGPEMEAASIRAALRVQRPGHAILGVNVSLSLLTHPAIVAALPGDLGGIVLEITEDRDADLDVLLDETLADLRRRGALIAIDDFGTGYSNLDRVLSLCPDVVKLDMSLVQGLASPGHQAAVRAVVGWAEEMGVLVCAEGVETEEQLHWLREIGVHSAQGYLLGRPASPETLIEDARAAVPVGRTASLGRAAR